jgi:NADPH:quinone reductase-like Zn-dependent oxidoreductase
MPVAGERRDVRAVRFHDHGGPETLQVDEDVDPPELGPGDVLVEAEAAGVNPVDTYFREGEYPVPGLPFVPGSDLAGVVAGVGADVDRFETGDRVFGTGLGNGRPGTYAEGAVAPASYLAHLPEGVDFEQGAALALVGVTSWQALVHHAGVEPAERVLIHGASGGVGHVAVQLAASMGADVAATAREAYHDDLDTLGATATVDYDADLGEALSEFGAPHVILDTRVNEYLGVDTAVAAQGARIVGIGNTANEATISPVKAAKSKELDYQFMSMYNRGSFVDPLERLGRLCERGDVVPEIARTYDLREAGEAQRAVMEESFLGKLVLTV